MSNHYKKGRLVETNKLPRHNNTWYYHVGGPIYEYYSYDTLVGYILVNEFFHHVSLFVEWAHTEHYSVTTSKQCTTLKNELIARYGTRCKIVTMKQGMKWLNHLKENYFKALERN